MADSPHEAEARLEMRAFDDAVFESAVAAIQSHAGMGTVTAGSSDFVCQVNITQTRQTPPWPRNPASRHSCPPARASKTTLLGPSTRFAKPAGAICV